MMPVETRWISASLLERLVTRLMEFSTIRTDSSVSSTFRTNLSTLSHRRLRCGWWRASGVTLNVAFSTLPFVQAEAARYLLGPLAVLLCM